MYCERKFVLDGVQQDCRNDGRTAFMSRDIRFRPKVSKLAAGSSSVSVGLGAPALVIGVKADISVPKCADSGFCEVSVEFAKRTGSTRELSERLAKLLDALMLKHFDTTQLDICSGEKCWGLFIDIVVMLPDASNLLELMSYGIYKALQSTLIPEVEGVLNKRTGELFLDLKSSSFSLDLTSLPLISSVYLIGDRLLIDASAEEELFASGVIHTSVRDNHILGLIKERPGGFSPAQVLHSVKAAFAASSVVESQLTTTRIQYTLNL
mmetsp:Transcript_2519/g.5788  ORF Transcript_2519/g.5788 Transcript_2519/m.5788 type:complete len:266 (+) Transcript_2519:32-829(+)